MLIASSTLVLIILGFGLYFRKKKKLHIPLMASAFIIDLSLVLIIEFQRHAVENVIASPSPFVIFHATISGLVLVLYIALANIGMKMAKLSTGTQLIDLTSTHVKLAKVFIVFRLINYVTSFYMV